MGAGAWHLSNTGSLCAGYARFRQRYFRQEAQDVKFGALVTPFDCDWDRVVPGFDLR